MKPKTAINRLLRRGIAAELKRLGYTKKGIRFCRAAKPDMYYRVEFIPERFSDSDSTAFSIELAVAFRAFHEALVSGPFPKNPLSAITAVVTDISVLCGQERRWELLTSREGPDEPSVAESIREDLEQYAFPFLARVQSIEDAYEVFKTVPQPTLSLLAHVESEVTFLVLLGRRKEAADLIQGQLRDREVDDPYAEAVRELGDHYALLVDEGSRDS
jgi:hypothetical protein